MKFGASGASLLKKNQSLFVLVGFRACRSMNQTNQLMNNKLTTSDIIVGYD
jgi:hypothetical protein